MKLTVLFVCLAVLALSQFAWAQTSDVPADHWAYQAVTKLADKGLVTGYPDGRFLGDRTLTRYEFATIIKRVLDYVAAQDSGAPSPAPSTPAVGSTPTAPTAPTVTPEDLADIRKLVDEFKVELTVIGTRLDKVEAEVADMKSKVDMHDAMLNDEEGVVQATKADVAKLKKVTVSGYIQNRYELFADNTDEDGSAVKNTFLIRRARAKITAKPTEKTTGVLQLDAGGGKVTVKDAYIDYAFNNDVTLGPVLSIGQMNWPFGYEVPYSSSKRETPERTLWSRRFFPGERDRGAKVAFPVGESWLGQIGVFDGTGIETVNTVTTVVTDSTTDPQTTTKIKSGSNVGKDYDNNKDVVANLQYNGENMEFGISGYFGRGIWNSDRAAMVSVPKTRYGADFRYFWNNLTLKAEYVRAKGVDEATSTFDNSKWIDAYCAQLNYNLSKADTLVARYESLSEDPKKPALGRRSAWNLGLLHWLDGNTRVKLFYQDNTEQISPIDNNIWRLEFITTY